MCKICCIRIEFDWCVWCFLVEGRFRTCASKWKQTAAHRPQFIQRNLCTHKFIFTQFIPDGYVITVWFWKYQWVQSTTVAHPQSHMHFQPNSPLFDNLSNVIDKWNIPTNDFYSLVVWYFSHACASVCLSPCACVCVCVKHGFYDTRSRLFIFLDMFACFVSLLVRFPQKTHVLWFSFPYSIRLFLVGGCFFVSQKAMFKYVSLCIWTVVAVCVGVFHMLN